MYSPQAPARETGRTTSRGQPIQSAKPHLRQIACDTAPTARDVGALNERAPQIFLTASHWQHGSQARTVRPAKPTHQRPVYPGERQMPASRTVLISMGAAMLLASSNLTLAHAKPFMIVGLDEKTLWDADGKPILAADGKDSVLILDLANPESPKTVVSLPLKNSVVGPPVNVDIDPTGSIALVADSVDVTKDGDTLKQVPDNKIYVIDLKANPPKLAATITGGKQPSGLNISPSGKMALVANRGDNSISVLSINGTDVKITDTIAMPDSVAHVMFTPDGKRALAVRFPAHKISLLDVNGDKVAYNKVDLPTGQWPYNVVVTPNGKIALTSDNGGAGSSDGSVDTSSVIDLEANPPRIIDRVVVGRPRGPGDVAEGRSRGRRHPARLQHEECVLLPEERQRLGAEGRRQEGDQDPGYRGRRLARSRTIHA
jgi:hypothetical protein